MHNVFLLLKTEVAFRVAQKALFVYFSDLRNISIVELASLATVTINNQIAMLGLGFPGAEKRTRREQ